MDKLNSLALSLSVCVVIRQEMLELPSVATGRHACGGNNNRTCLQMLQQHQGLTTLRHQFVPAAKKGMHGR